MSASQVWEGWITLLIPEITFRLSQCNYVITIYQHYIHRLTNYILIGIKKVKAR